MTFEQLQFFYCVAQHNSFSKAAFELNITQSALSKQIAKLEQELGILLFDRSKRQISLTSQGEAVLDDVLLILKHYNTMFTHIQQLKNNSTLNIASLPILSQYHLSSRLHSFSKHFPSINISLHEIEEKDLTNSLDLSKYDLYILRNFPNDSSYCCKPIIRDSLCALIPASHPLKNKKCISLSALSQDNIILPPHYTYVSQTILNYINKNQIFLTITHYCRLESLIEYVSTHQGIGLVMKETINAFQLKGCQCIPILEDITTTINAYYDPNHAHATHIQKLIHYLSNTK